MAEGKMKHLGWRFWWADRWFSRPGLYVWFRGDNRRLLPLSSWAVMVAAVVAGFLAQQFLPPLPWFVFYVVMVLWIVVNVVELVRRRRARA